MAQYIIYAQYDRSQTVIEGSTSLKGARQKAYRAAKRYPKAKYIGIETIKDFHTPYKAARTRVRMAEDGKIYATVGRKKRELRSTGEYAVDTVRRESEDIFAWYKGETKKPKAVPKNTATKSDFVKNHIIVAKPAPVSPTYYRIKGEKKTYTNMSAVLKAARAYVIKVEREEGDAIILTVEIFKEGQKPVPVGYVRDGFFSRYQTQIVSMQIAGKLRGNGPFMIYEDAYGARILKSDGSFGIKL